MIPVGHLQDCFRSDYAGVYEVFCHPLTAQQLLAGGMEKVNGSPVTVEKIDEYPHGWQLRIRSAAGDPEAAYAWAA